MLRFKGCRQAGNEVLICVLLMIITGMLFFGLRPKQYCTANWVQWHDDDPGIGISGRGMASAEGVDFAAWQENGFTVAMAFKPEFDAQSGFQFLLVAHDGADARQMVIGQWRTHLMLMNGDDYDRRRKAPKLFVDLKDHGATVFLVLAAGIHGVDLFLNGQREMGGGDPHLKLQWPGGDGLAWMVVGSSVDGNHGWQGDLLGLAVFKGALDADAAEELYRRWLGQGEFSVMRRDGVAMLHPFNERGGEIAADISGNGVHLALPVQRPLLRRELLAPPWRHVEFAGWLAVDVTLNFFGFWPLGFFLAAAFRRWLRLAPYNWQAAICCCFLFSLSIEIAQAWMVARSSHMLDLLLNTMGGAAGALLYNKIRATAARVLWQFAAH